MGEQYADSAALAPGSTIKALTLWQPWATLVGIGAKTIETRGWDTSYRGWLAIHAAKTAKPWDELWEEAHQYPYLGAGAIVNALGCPEDWLGWDFGDGGIVADCWSAGARIVLNSDGLVMPLGAIVAVARLLDVVPMEKVLVVNDQDWPGRDSGRANKHWWWVGSMDDEPFSSIEVPLSEAVLGDYGPGRFAWLLGGIRLVREPIPARGRQQLWDWTIPEGVHFDGSETR